MKGIKTAMAAMAAVLLAGMSKTNRVKVGMITAPSGGVADLGINLREAVKEGEVLTNRIVGAVREDRADACTCAAQCSM